MLKKTVAMLLMVGVSQANFSEVTDSNFEKEVLQSDRPVVLKAYVPGCSACLVISPIFNILSNEYDPRYKFVEINVRSNAGVRSRYNLKMVPVVLFFKDGKEVGRKGGVMTKSVFARLIEQYLRY